MSNQKFVDGRISEAPHKFLLTQRFDIDQNQVKIFIQDKTSICEFWSKFELKKEFLPNEPAVFRMELERTPSGLLRTDETTSKHHGNAFFTSNVGNLK
jgi:hypothetical protein